MKRKYIYQNTLLVVLAIVFLLAFTLAYKYQNKTIPEINFQKTPEFNFLDKDYAYISGSVSNPGVYEINPNTRIVDLISEAGGFSINTDKDFVAEQINLSKIVEDGEHIFIPANVQSTNILGNSNIQNQNETGLISINNATSTELETLPGVGPATAKKIIDARPYTKINDLLKVPGIGEATLNKISPLVSL